MRLPTLTILTLALLVAATPATLGAQESTLAQEPTEAQPPRGEFGEELEVTEVLLDVLVTDRQGNVIIGLGPDDFVVEEDGRPVDVTGVSFYSNRRLAGPAPADLEGRLDIETLPEDRYFILLFEDQRQKAADTGVDVVRQQLDAARFAKQWVERELLPNDWVAVASYDFKLKLQTDFTRDEKTLVKAIDAAMKGRDTGSTWPSRTREAAASGAPSLAAGLPAGDELRKASLRIYDAIGLLADAAGEIRGRKNLLLFTTGFGQINNVGQYLQDPRYYPPMMQALNDNNVAAYTIDLTPNNVDHVMSDAMNQLAEETGGEYYFNFTNFLTPLTRIAEENNGYYLLAYQSRHPRGESGYQKVLVRTENPQFRVKAREGYVYGQGPSERGLSSAIGD
ncbi:MAG TPA: VWA domain-containing protein [Thermoanaerobaculia bacterium]|nr:VWA domain-containing protein [Thermoanaerobaculia bacterium]